MSTIFYKVIFKTVQNNEADAFSLTFRSIITSKPINIPSHYFSRLKELSKENKDVIYFQNIQEVIKIGQEEFAYTFNYYVVLLLTSISDRKKQGFLIGNAKKLGDILMGVWPFNQEQLNYTTNFIVNLFDNLIKTTNFENISIIYS